MVKSVTVYYALESPWAYLGWARLHEISARTGATIDYRVIDTAAAFAASGTLPIARRPRQRLVYRLMELRRWRDFLGLPLVLEPEYFPVDERLAAGMVIAHGRRGGDIGALSQAIFTAVWVDQRDISDPTTLRAIADEQAQSGEALLEDANSPAVRAEYEANTKAAIERGVFGVPTFVIGDELFWGQDRLDFVERALA